VDDVIYPGETRLIGKLIQLAVNKGERGIPPAAGQPFLGYHSAERLWVCEAMNLEYEISAEGVATLSDMQQLNEETLTLPFRIR
jgi:hypothetical protein